MTVTTIKIEQIINHTRIILFPSLLRKKDKVYLIDCGYEETFGNLVGELSKIGIQVNQIHGIIISHDDIDHLGALKKFKEQNESIEIYCGSFEKDSVSGKIKSERLVQAESSLGDLTGDYRNWALGFIHALTKIKRLEVDKTFHDGEIFEDEIQILHTPGHTKGHISLFIPNQRILIANDALVAENGSFEIANPTFTLDLKNAIKSVEKIKALKPQKVICYHGGIVEEDVEAKLEDLICRYKPILDH
ncbi:MBL fold metallo-hydrolase [Pararhodonellum marinum]|uniref:MBL fold metallo-hydrolase n=1 Tax=Pararhodonellum marinum TaxID=2755358 RepID=UPI00188FF3B6|nr:MBL fold metallo-hydrolase [Pararhodonellum marinum]